MIDIGEHILLAGRVLKTSWRDGPLLFYAGDRFTA